MHEQPVPQVVLAKSHEYRMFQHMSISGSMVEDGHFRISFFLDVCDDLGH